jgi:heme A synthase
LHPARRWANLSVVFIVTEALLGAGLVLFRLVEHDDSLARTLSMPLHLVNTFILLACLTATAWFARSDPPRTAIVGRPALLVATLPLAIAVSATGAVAALGDTLFPAASLTAGIGQDFAATAHVLLRLRLIHPVLAFLSALVFAVAALRAGRPGRMVLVLVFTQIVAGVLNIALLAPVWMQLLHLLIADVLWVSLVVLVFEAKRHQVG